MRQIYLKYLIKMSSFRRAEVFHPTQFPEFRIAWSVAHKGPENGSVLSLR
jgi:hypothetical protein